MTDYDNTNLKKLPKSLPPDERFDMSYMPEPNSGCWIWLGSEQGSNGYGRIKVNNKQIVAHRYSYSMHIGEIPKNMLVLHKCDTPLCVNPDHLFLGTHQDNMNDMVRKGRQSRSDHKRASGESNGNSKLTRLLAEKIRNDKRPQRKIASIYGITQAAVSQIKTGKTWR